MDTAGKIKLDAQEIQQISSQPIDSYFGDWIHHLPALKEKYTTAYPFEHVVLDNFLSPAFAEALHAAFPTDTTDWFVYENPIEVKYVYDDIHNPQLDPLFKQYFHLLSSDPMVQRFRTLTDIPDLTYDEYLHGAGLHCHPRHGKLNIHLDYEKHPYSGKERRLNVIYFLSKNWNPEWKGSNELWDANVTQCIQKTEVVFNRAIVFKTNDISWHGLPDPLQCPDKICRMSLAYYYVSPLNTSKDEKEYRKKAKYTRRPCDPPCDKLDQLFEIRSSRRIEPEDRPLYFPNWSKEDG